MLKMPIYQNTMYYKEKYSSLHQYVEDIHHQLIKRVINILYQWTQFYHILIHEKNKINRSRGLVLPPTSLDTSILNFSINTSLNHSDFIVIEIIERLFDRSFGCENNSFGKQFPKTTFNFKLEVTIVEKIKKTSNRHRGTKVIPDNSFMSIIFIPPLGIVRFPINVLALKQRSSITGFTYTGRAKNPINKRFPILLSFIILKTFFGNTNLLKIRAMIPHHETSHSRFESMISNWVKVSSFSLFFRSSKLWVRLCLLTIINSLFLWSNSTLQMPLRSNKFLKSRSENFFLKFTVTL